jgi:dTDP-4-amino-4,6-dideoxygalactose transaminase
MIQQPTSQLASDLSQAFGFAHAVLFGRARAGLVALLEETTAAGAPALIPSNICSAVLAAVIASGRRPVPVATSATTGLVEDAVFAEAIRAEPTPGLVMPTHHYGVRVDYPLTTQVAAELGWTVVENDSLGAAAFDPGEKRHVGLALLTSFGKGKPIDGGGGGGVLTDDRGLVSALAKRAKQWPEFDEAAEAVETHATLARRHLVALDLSGTCEDLLAVEAAHCRHRFDETLTPDVRAAIRAFPNSNRRRLERLEMWNQALAPIADEIRVPALPARAAWRAIFYVPRPGLRDKVAHALRAGGFDAGVNYPPLWEGAPRLLSGARRESGDQWGRSVLALWLTDDYDQSRIAAAAETIVGVVEMERRFGQIN